MSTYKAKSSFIVNENLENQSYTYLSEEAITVQKIY